MYELLIILIPLILKYFADKKKKLSMKTLMYKNSTKDETWKLIGFYFSFGIVYLLCKNFIPSNYEVNYSSFALIVAFVFNILILEVDLSNKKKIYKSSKISVIVIFLVLFLLLIISFSLMISNYQYSLEFRRIPLAYKELGGGVVTLVCLLLLIPYYSMANNIMNRVLAPDIKFVGFYKYKNRVKKVNGDDLIIDKDNYIFLRYKNHNTEVIGDSAIVIMDKLMKVETKVQNKFRK